MGTNYYDQTNSSGGYSISDLSKSDVADPSYGTKKGSIAYDDGRSTAILDPYYATLKKDKDPYTDLSVKSLMHSNHLYSQSEINQYLYTDTFRFGFIAPSDTLSIGKEYLFFTKPDLNIIAQNDNATVKSNVLNSALASRPYWVDLYNSRKDIIECLQQSYTLRKDRPDNFNHLLQNMVTNNLDVPSLTAETIDTPTNMYGVNYSYRGSSEGSDDNPEFTLEFKDTKNLDVYHFFKAYDEYEVLKHHGVISPSKFYITNKILHDQFSIYKFILDDDLETIIYYGKMYGVMPKSPPRDVFSNPNFDTGISYSIDFKAAFYEDMRPEILADFNALNADLYKNCKYKLSTYNPYLGRTDNRVARSAYVVKEVAESSSNNRIITNRAKSSSTKYVYKLKWKGEVKE